VYEKENIKATDESIKAICIQGEGSVRDTLSVADVCASYAEGNVTYETVLAALGTTNTKVLNLLSNAIIQKDANSLLKTIHSLFEDGKNFGILTRDLISYFRNLLLIKNIANANEYLNLPQDVFTIMQEKAKSVTEQKRY
jgi:DNA polymerase-3 subunit gamma/tau